MLSHCWVTGQWHSEVWTASCFEAKLLSKRLRSLWKMPRVMFSARTRSITVQASGPSRESGSADRFWWSVTSLCWVCKKWRSFPVRLSHKSSVGSWRVPMGSSLGTPQSITLPHWGRWLCWPSGPRPGLSSRDSMSPPQCLPTVPWCLWTARGRVLLSGGFPGLWGRNGFWGLSSFVRRGGATANTREGGSDDDKSKIKRWNPKTQHLNRRTGTPSYPDTGCAPSVGDREGTPLLSVDHLWLPGCKTHDRSLELRILFDINYRLSFNYSGHLYYILGQNTAVTCFFFFFLNFGL